MRIRTILTLTLAFIGYQKLIVPSSETQTKGSTTCDVLDISADELEVAVRSISQPHKVIISKSTYDRQEAVLLDGFARPEHFSRLNKSFKSRCIRNKDATVLFYIKVSKEEPLMKRIF